MSKKRQRISDIEAPKPKDIGGMLNKDHIEDWYKMYKRGRKTNNEELDIHDELEKEFRDA